MGKTTLGLSKSEHKTHTPHPTWLYMCAWLLLVLYLLMSAKNVPNSIRVL